jgi:hypothetical protein
LIRSPRSGSCWKPESWPAKTSRSKPPWLIAPICEWSTGCAASAGGWNLIYLALPSAEMSKLRVAERVAHGGHAIPEADIERRFPRSLRHLLDDFSRRVDRCICLMNDGENPELIFEQCGDQRNILRADDYQLLLEKAER